MSEELLESYWQKGGDYVIPVPVINEWLCEYEELKQMLSLVNEMNIANYNKYCEALKVNEEHQKLNGQLMICISELENRINKAVDKLYCWGETLDGKFQKEMLDILEVKN